MKNILAENMLRFGVKNLSELDIKNIEESVLTEAFTDPNGIVWPWFKDQKSVDALNNIALQRPSADTGAYGVIFGQAGAAEAKKRMGTEYSTGFQWAFWNALALNPNMPAIIPTSMAAVVGNVFKNSITKLNQYNAIKKTAIPPSYIWEAISNPENIKWWDSPVEFPVGSKKMMTRWQIFSQNYLAASLPKVKALYVTPTAKPATPTMQPGTAKAPVKPQ
jgi:hypothetical protein